MCLPNWLVELDCCHMWQSINKADMLLAVAGEREDVDDSSNDGENDCRFWICQTVAPARKLTKQFAEDSMLILVGKWVVDVRWFKVCMSFLDEI